jgi:hypothetical protein
MINISYREWMCFAPRDLQVMEGIAEADELGAA